MLAELQAELKSNMPQIRILLKRNPGIAYTRITEIGTAVGKRHGVKLLVNFPQRSKIAEFEMYGRRDLSVIVDMTRTRFPIERDVIRKRAEGMASAARVEDAYMYEGKEGLKVFLENGRIDILPHSLHVWCEFTPEVLLFCEWLFGNAYASE